MLPFWLERQTDIDGPDFLPGRAGDLENLTHRTWSMIGTVATPDRGVVDPRGLVTPRTPGDGGGWSLDWWVGADDRWHLPASEAAVRQRLVGGSPVVETVMRIPGGDAVARVYAIHAAGDSPFGQAFAVVEIENASAVPFAVALAVRPYHPLGFVDVDTIALDGTTVLVNGQPGLLLPRLPARAAATTGADSEVAEVVTGGTAPETFDAVHDPQHRAQAAFIFPLPHTAVLRVALPLSVGYPAAPARGRGRRSGPSSGSQEYPAAVPSAEQVAKGWEAQTRRGLRLSLPDPTWEAAVEAGRGWLLVAHGGEDLAGWPSRPLDWVDAEPVLGALAEQGFAEEAAQVLATWPERQALDGSLVGPGGGAAANGAALVALARHHRLTGDDRLVDEIVGPVAKAVHWIDKRRRARRGTPAFTSTELEWSRRGLTDAAVLLDAIGQPEVATDARRFAAVLAAGAPTTEPSAVEVSGPAVVDPVGRAGLSPRATLSLATGEMEAGDLAALERFGWVLGAAAPTWTWPAVIHPRTGDGSAGAGHDTVTGAEVLRFVRRALVRETDDGLALCSMVPESWWGQGLEVHDAPTGWGRLSFALRWHGERPALLWDLEPHPDRAGPPASITVPGLDPTWRTTEPRDEALLAAPASRSIHTDGPIGTAEPDPGASLS